MNRNYFHWNKICIGMFSHYLQLVQNLHKLIPFFNLNKTPVN